jgi:hypothetical protein
MSETVHDDSNLIDIGDHSGNPASGRFELLSLISDNIGVVEVLLAFCLIAFFEYGVSKVSEDDSRLFSCGWLWNPFSSFICEKDVPQLNIAM